MDSSSRPRSASRKSGDIPADARFLEGIGDPDIDRRAQRARHVERRQTPPILRPSGGGRDASYCYEEEFAVMAARWRWPGGEERSPKFCAKRTGRHRHHNAQRSHHSENQKARRQEIADGLIQQQLQVFEPNQDVQFARAVNRAETCRPLRRSAPAVDEATRSSRILKPMPEAERTTSCR